MALGAITKPSGASDYDVGNKRVRVRDVVLSSGANYTTGGETITPRRSASTSIFEAIPLGSR
jgi:hypothetical protein